MFQFRSLTVEAGQTLTVPSGVTIRVSGDVTINGTITVDPNPDQNINAGLPDLGACSDIVPTSATSSAGGSGGIAISQTVALQLVNPPLSEGGGNGGGFSTLSGLGGGIVRVFASGKITIAATGSITADGEPGNAGTIVRGSGGGGAGGIIILAAGTSISNGGTISASGGAGGNALSSPASGPSGGGGGGIVHFLSPSNTQGTVLVTGGAGGTGGSSGKFSNANGGGACGGNGGASGDTTGVAGIAGRILISTVPNPSTVIIS